MNITEENGLGVDVPRIVEQVHYWKKINAIIVITLVIGYVFYRFIDLYIKIT